jgi:pyruvate formate lyase activating enzyme
MKVNYGGIVPLSTVDWPRRAAMVIFLRGCPLRCPYCQNSKLQTGENFVEFSQIADKIKRTKNLDCVTNQITLKEAFCIATTKTLISAIVISGGEPLMQPEQIKMIAALSKSLGFDVGLETSGYYPDRLSDLLVKKLVDKVFIDIKAPLTEPEYEIATGQKNVSSRVLESLKICMKLGVPLTARTTIFSESQFPSGGSQITKVLSNLKAEFPENRLDVKVLQRGINRMG